MDDRQKAKEMRDAIDHIEGALMGFGCLADLPEAWGEPRHRGDIAVTIKVTTEQVYRVCDALAELNRIINDDEYRVE